MSKKMAYRRPSQKDIIYQMEKARRDAMHAKMMAELEANELAYEVAKEAAM